MNFDNFIIVNNPSPKVKGYIYDETFHLYDMFIKILEKEHPDFSLLMIHALHYLFGMYDDKKLYVIDNEDSYIIYKKLGKMPKRNMAKKSDNVIIVNNPIPRIEGYDFGREKNEEMLNFLKQEYPDFSDRMYRFLLHMFHRYNYKILYIKDEGNSNYVYIELIKIPKIP
jgi:hypothetical protein